MSAVYDNLVSLSDTLLRQALDMSTEGVVVLECDGDLPCVRYANSQFTRLSGFTLEELATLKWPDLCRDICAEEVTDSLVQSSSYCGSVLMERADGTRWRTGVRVRRLMGERGDADMWLCQFVPCALLGNGDAEFAGIWFDAEAANSRNRISRLDRIDGSSGLLRFERFRDFLDRDIALARREKKAATLMLLKIMEFDEYRCTFGVNAANSCLRMIGKQVTASLRRRTDLCARMNEDTIAAALFGQTADVAWKMLDRICEKVDGLRVHNPRGRLSRFLTLRCVVVSSEPVSDESSIDALLAAADSDLARVAIETLSA
jgi:diguanylate cyclase (GGDEF)-like protein